MAEKKVNLNVSEAQQEDVDKGIVRIDSQVMKQIGIHQGDIVEIEGERKTVAIAGRAFPADLGLSIIRMDPLTRRNAKTSIGEKVSVTKIKVTPAKRIRLAPIKGKVIIQGDMSGLKRPLLGRAVSKGDIISLGGARRRRSAFRGSPFEELFESMMSGDEFMTGGFGFGGLKLMVVSTNPKDAVLVTEETALDYTHEAVELKEDIVPDIAYEDIGGLEEEIKNVREMIEIPLKHPEIFERLGVVPPKGVLLHGPPGTGKTLLAKAVANESQANFLTLNGPEIMSKFVGEAEKKLRQLFEDAEKNAPSIIFIDEIDAIAPKREESYGEVERRVVAQLLAVMDGMKGRGKVIVIAATNRPDSLDPALRRSGRFDREIDIGVPNRKGRLEIFKIHTRNMPLKKDVNLEKLSDRTYGFVGADIEGVCKEAAMNVIRRDLDKYNFEEDKPIPPEILEKLIVSKKDFDVALRFVRPSAMREVLVEVAKTKWDDVGGLKKAKQELIETVEWPLKKPKVFSDIGIRPPKGVLLYGPPGTGKTLLAKAVATESGANFISVKGPEIISKWVGESEKAIRDIFKKARQVAPSIIFFDEIDAIASTRGASSGGGRTDEKVVNQILTEMDGMESMKDVVVIAASNRPELIDNALLRPGRFDRHILVTPPTEAARLAIFEVHTKNMPTKGINLKDLVKKTNNYSGADIENLIREAGMLAIREDAKEVSKKHFDQAMKVVGPSLTKSEATKYEKALKAQAMARKDKPDYFG